VLIYCPTFLILDVGNKQTDEIIMRKIIYIITIFSLLISCNEQKKPKQETEKQETKEIVIERKIEPEKETENKPKTENKSTEKELTESEFLSVFLLENELIEKNVIEKYNSFDFSPIWTKTENHIVYGIIGKDNERLKIKLISITKSKNDPNEYIIFGKSKVKENICDFTGRINLKKIQEVKELHYGVDEMYKGKGIKSQGLIIAEYSFSENNEQSHSGVFTGKLYSKWYLDKNNQIQYDNIENISDSYSNNAFIGIWKMYGSNLIKKSNWSDFRVPNPTSDFDIGAGEFSPNKKYYNKGWENYSKAFVFGDEKAKKDELKKWWK